MRITLMIVVLLCGMASTARADVTYTLIDRVYDLAARSVGAFLNVSLTVSDAAVERGSFTLSGTGDFLGPVTYSGDVADFVSFTANETATPDECMCGSISLNASFASDGAISSAAFDYFGIDEGSELRGSGAAFGGYFNSDNFDFGCSLNVCTVSGRLVSDVPEPATGYLLGASILALIQVTRRRAFLGREDRGCRGPRFARTSLTQKNAW